MLIVDAAITVRPPIVSMSRRLPGGFLVASFLIAILLLLFKPSGGLGLALSIPAAVTLLATAGRLGHRPARVARPPREAFQLAQTDDLTGLPNRRAVLRSSTRASRTGEPPGPHAARTSTGSRR